MFLSFYCDYIVDEIAIFLHFSNFFPLKLLIFDGQMTSPKISVAYFRWLLFPAARMC
jgi:hypothetical protein